jgi:hypothetical protein
VQGISPVSKSDLTAWTRAQAGGDEILLIISSTMILTGIAHLERKFRDSLIASFVVSESHKLIPADGEYMVKIGEYDRKLVISSDGLELYVFESDGVEFGKEMEIIFV